MQGWIRQHWPGLLLLILLALGVAWTASNIIGYVQTSYNFDRTIGDKFELSDAASAVPVKLRYFNSFVQAMKDNDLTAGQSSVWFQRPRNDLANIWNITLSVQTRLVSLNQTCTSEGQSSFACTTSLKQLTTDEYCFFPINIIRDGWLLKHGYGWAVLLPSDVKDRCAPAK